MSGSLTVISNTASLLFGGAGGVSLGGIFLSDMEVPERIPWGGRQHLVVHKMPGGMRVIDAMGPDEKPLEWQAYFHGPAAVARARQIDNMRQAGQPVTLSWGSFSRQVVIASFECEFANGGFLLPYRISCEVVVGQPGFGALGLLGALGADLAGALSSVADVVSPILAPVQSALSEVQTVMPLAGALASGSSAFVGVQSALSEATNAVGVASGLADTAMGGIITAGTATGNVLGASAAATGIAALVNGSAAAQAVAAAQQVGGYVGRMASNLAGASA